MYCSSCEILIERKLKKIEGIKEVKVNHHTGIAEIKCAKEPSIEELQEAIKETKYKVLPIDAQTSRKNKFEDYFEVAAYFVILFGAYYFLRQLNLIPAIGISDLPYRAPLRILFNYFFGIRWVSG